MLYESDISTLLSEWQQRLGEHSGEPSYKDALNDCIYDLNCLIDKNNQEEALARESFEQKLMSEGRWDEWFDSLIS